jgi:Domain of unknown function (DUF6473)
MTLKYQLQDFEVLDYNLYYLEGMPDLLRGSKPPSLAPDSYIAYAGAAQTFGVFCQYPYPNLLTERLCIPALNLGFGGAGPQVFLKKELLHYINHSKLAVIQVLSGRSINNSLLFSPHGSSAMRRVDEPTAPLIQAGRHYARILKEFEESKVRELIAETRSNWTAAMIEVLKKIEVPKILLWFSTRSPDYPESYTSKEGLLGEFPQLINLETIEPLFSYVDRFVDATTNRGIPQPFLSRFTGKPIKVNRDGEIMTENKYYPSPQMHQDAADLLEPVIRDLLNT